MTTSPSKIINLNELAEITALFQTAEGQKALEGFFQKAAISRDGKPKTPENSKTKGFAEATDHYTLPPI